MWFQTTVDLGVDFVQLTLTSFCMICGPQICWGVGELGNRRVLNACHGKGPRKNLLSWRIS